MFLSVNHSGYVRQVLYKCSWNFPLIVVKNKKVKCVTYCKNEPMGQICLISCLVADRGGKRSKAYV